MKFILLPKGCNNLKDYVINKLTQLLVQHEGTELMPYVDTTGHVTIGVGRNLTSVGISWQEAMILLENDIQRIQKEADDNFPWFKNLSPNRQIVVLDMIFNLGLSGFMGFRKTISFIRRGQWENAAREMLNSIWAQQVGSRADRLSHIMLTNELNFN